MGVDLVPDAVSRSPTLWRATVGLLEACPADSSSTPARSDNGDRYSAWAHVVNEVKHYFSSVGRPRKAIGPLDPVAKEHISRWIEESWDELGRDVYDAIAYGIDAVVSSTFIAAWQTELRDPTHVLRPGECFPVGEPDVRAALGRRAATSRPQSLLRPPPGELAHVRRFQPSGFEVAFDFRNAVALESVLAFDHTVATGHPNRTLADFDVPDGPNVFPVRLDDESDQQRRILDLVRESTSHGVRTLVLPELSTTPDIVTAISAALDDAELQQLVVAGSAHVGEEHHARRNVAYGVLGDAKAPLEHHKFTPFADELGPGRPSKEGIALSDPIRLTIHQGGLFRLCLLVCKDALDPRTTSVLAHLGVNCVAVPAMSRKTDSFVNAARNLAVTGQARMVVANGPLIWDGKPVAPAAVFGQPVAGEPTVEAADFSERRGPTLVRYSIAGSDPTTSTST